MTPRRSARPVRVDTGKGNPSPRAEPVLVPLRCVFLRSAERTDLPRSGLVDARDSYGSR